MVEETKAVVEREEEEAGKKALATQAIAEDAQKDLGQFLRFSLNLSNLNIILSILLDEAMPALLAAEQSLKSLNKNDIIEVRSMKRPPAGVIYVIEAICIVKNIKPNKVLTAISNKRALF